jgi:GTP-binding protein
VYIIIDAFVGPAKLDFNMAEWLNAYNVPFKIVANKCDKIPKNIMGREIKSKVAECFNIDESDVFTVSAKEKIGFDGLKEDIVRFLNV